MIADVFEALTAADRPYKRANTLSETMAIMGAMKRDHHVDPAHGLRRSVDPLRELLAVGIDELRRRFREGLAHA